MRAELRREKRDRYLEAAVTILLRDGFDGLTMSAIAREVDAAVGTIYGYFSSKDALINELQVHAVQTVLDAWREAREQWADQFGTHGLDDTERTLAELLAYGLFFVQVRDAYPEEFQLQRMLFDERRSDDEAEVPPLTEVTSELLQAPLELIERAEALGLFEGRHRPADRALALVLALTGQSLVANVPEETGLADVSTLAELVTADLSIAWGAEASRVHELLQVVRGVCAELPVADLPGHASRRERGGGVDLRGDGSGAEEDAIDLTDRHAQTVRG